MRSSFFAIPQGQIDHIEVNIEGVGAIDISVITTKDTDRTTRHHGVAWHVNTRLVGDCSWKGITNEDLIDGRTSSAKRFTFIVHADLLASPDSRAIRPDWTGFNEEDPLYKKVAPPVFEKIKEFLFNASEEDRRATLAKAKSVAKEQLSRVSLISVEKWKTFMMDTQVKCPSIGEKDLLQLGTLLANLEESHSQFALIRKLGDMKSDDLDNLDQLLQDWTLDMAKIVLDELKTRLQLVAEIKRKVADSTTDEVQELQPLFKQGLWIFGPEFETIHFTSNVGMTRVIQELFGGKVKGSRNRPDFAILPDGTAGLYSYPEYDDETGGETGVAQLVIVELKKPKIPLNMDHKQQCMKYVYELLAKGQITQQTKVRCFPIGSSIAAFHEQPMTEGNTKITPLTYDTVVRRAESRLLGLMELTCLP